MGNAANLREALPAETRQAILADACTRDFRITLRLTRLKKPEDEELL